MNQNTVTEDGINGKIDKVMYTVIPSTMVTVCCIKLHNGYYVGGESACTDPANFNEELERKNAYEDALRKIWAL